MMFTRITGPIHAIILARRIPSAASLTFQPRYKTVGWTAADPGGRTTARQGMFIKAGHAMTVDALVQPASIIHILMNS
jgi:hypothetical protein